jgi:hypothetical protein
MNTTAKKLTKQPVPVFHSVTLPVGVKCISLYHSMLYTIRYIEENRLNVLQVSPVQNNNTSPACRVMRSEISSVVEIELIVLQRDEIPVH